MATSFSGAEFWDDRFGENEYGYGVQANDFLWERSDLFKAGDSVLCLAEGEGRNGVFLAKEGCKVRGVDFSEPGRKKALALAEKHGVTLDYELADLTAYEMPPYHWDGIVSIFCHLPEEQRPALYESIKGTLKPGGVFLLESYNKEQLTFKTGGPPVASHLFNLDELREAFPDFEIVWAQDMERDIREGQFHHGMSSVTQFIARKTR